MDTIANIVVRQGFYRKSRAETLPGLEGICKDVARHVGSMYMNYYWVHFGLLGQQSVGLHSLMQICVPSRLCVAVRRMRLQCVSRLTGREKWIFNEIEDLIHAPLDIYCQLLAH